MLRIGGCLFRTAFLRRSGSKNFNCEIGAKTNMKEIFSDGLFDIYVSRDLAFMNFYHLVLGENGHHQKEVFLQITMPMTPHGFFGMYDTAKSLMDHFVRNGLFGMKKAEPAKRTAVPAGEKKAEKKSAKSAPAKKAEAKPATKSAPGKKEAAPAKKETAPAEKAEAKPAPAPAKKAEAKPAAKSAAKPAPAPAKKAEAKPAAKPAPAKKPEAKAAAPAKKTAAKGKKPAK